MKRRLAVAETELHEARQSTEQGKTANGESELARQNEFLATQLEAMVATRSTPVTPVLTRSDPFGDRNDAGAQTDPIVMMTEREHKRLRSKPPSALKNVTVPKQYDQVPSSPRNTSASYCKAKTRIGRGKTRSFEDYLQQAQAELSELGSVISQNEALFAQKIQEHVGDLQRAKDQMAAEYKEKFDTLLAEREKMEKSIASQSAEEFAKRSPDAG